MFWPFRRARKTDKGLSAPMPRGGWITIFESYAGAWQQNVTVDREQVLTFHAIFSCITLISSDISKLRPKLVKKIKEIWKEVENKNYKVLEKPNGFQNRIQFLENWITSKLSRGNTYVLKERDAKGGVVALYVLNPDLVRVLVSDGGEVFYRLSADNVAGITEQVVVPATEIIHDRFNCLYHPLIGLSPIFASGLSAMQGLSIQNNSAKFFQNMSRPSGILSAPGNITKDAATEIKTAWEANFTAENIGKVAVLGNDLKYIALSVPAEQSQLVEQLKMTADVVCSTFHVPKYKVMGDAPSYNNIEALEQQYYSQCLQRLIEDVELCLDEGLEIKEGQGVELDLDGLLRMDTNTQVKTLKEGVSGTIYTPNEARQRMNLPAVTGGDTLYLQQQNYSVEALARRDAKDDPFAKGEAAPPAEPAEEPKEPPAEPEMSKDEMKLFLAKGYNA